MAQYERQRPEYPIKASTVNYGVEARELIENISASAGLELERTPSGRHFRIALGRTLVPALTTGTVAGGSYSSPVSASVTLLKQNGAGPGLTSSPLSVTAYNGFTNTTAIGSGKLVWITKFGQNYWIVAADCS